MRDYRNARAALWHDIYLIFNVKDSLQQYYNGRVDGVGPDKDEGLPEERRGVVSHLITFAGAYYAAVDAGKYGYSSVLKNNGSGWHEIYRAPAIGERIRRIHIQAIDGPMCDRLFISVGANIVWVPIEINPLSVPGEKGMGKYRYTHESRIITSYYYVRMKEVPKYLNALKLATEQLANTVDQAQVIDAYYRVDTDTEWTKVYDTDYYSFYQSFTQERKFSNYYDATGQRLQLMLVMQTFDNHKTPILVSHVIEMVMRVLSKPSLTLTFRVSDKGQDLAGNPDGQTVAGVLAQLRTWEQSPLPIFIEATASDLNGRIGFMEPGSVRLIGRVKEENRESYVYQTRMVLI